MKLLLCAILTASLIDKAVRPLLWIAETGVFDADMMGGTSTPSSLQSKTGSIGLGQYIISD